MLWVPENEENIKYLIHQAPGTIVIAFFSAFIKGLNVITVMVQHAMNLNPEGGDISEEMWFQALREFRSSREGWIRMDTPSGGGLALQGYDAFASVDLSYVRLKSSQSRTARATRYSVLPESLATICLSAAIL